LRNPSTLGAGQTSADDGDGPQQPLQPARDLDWQPLLDLEITCEELDNAGELREA
jgi:hypothetical protein